MQNKCIKSFGILFITLLSVSSIVSMNLTIFIHEEIEKRKKENTLRILGGTVTEVGTITVKKPINNSSVEDTIENNIQKHTDQWVDEYNKSKTKNNHTQNPSQLNKQQLNDYKKLLCSICKIESSKKKVQLQEFARVLLDNQNLLWQEINNYIEQESSDEEENSEEERSGVPTESSLKNKKQSQNQEI